MGIDVYLKWQGFDDPADWNALSKEEMHAYFEAHNAEGVYIRESYHSQSKATYVFIPETFDAGGWGPDEPEQHPLAEKLFDEEGEEKGWYIPGHVLRERLEAVSAVIFDGDDPYYDDEPEYAKAHYRAFEAFVEKVEDLELHDLKPWIRNSY